MGSYEFGGSKEYSKQGSIKKSKDKQKLINAICIIIAVVLIGGITAGYFALRAKAMDIANNGAGNPETLEADIMGALNLGASGNFEDINMRAALYANGEHIGGITEKGFVTSSFEIKADRQLVYTIIDSPEEVKDMDCRVFVFKDAKDNILGYAAEDYSLSGYKILDADKNDTGIIVGDNGEWIYGINDECLAYCYESPSVYRYYDYSFAFEKSDVPVCARLFALIREYKYLYDHYSMSKS